MFAQIAGSSYDVSSLFARVIRSNNLTGRSKFVFDPHEDVKLCSVYVRSENKLGNYSWPIHTGQTKNMALEFVVCS